MPPCLHPLSPLSHRGKGRGSHMKQALLMKACQLSSSILIVRGGVRVFYRVQLARKLVSFGAAVNNVAEYDNVVSSVASESRNWSTCLESEASHSKGCEPPAPVVEELLRILTEVVQDLGLDWSPLQQPARNRMDMWFLQSGRHAATPQRPALFFPEVHAEISQSSPRPSQGIAFAILCRRSRPLGVH